MENTTKGNEQRLKVLIVDDEAGIRKLLTSILKDDYEVAVAASVREAFQKMTEGASDIVLSDVKMPGEDGLALLREMSNLYPKIPVILMTGHGDKEIVIDALRGNAFDYLEKPFPDEVLLRALKRAADYINLERELGKAQGLVVQASKMSALGEMAGGIAHEINTPLGTIQLISDQIVNLLQDDPLDLKTLNEMVTVIQTTVRRISVTIRGLRAFSRDGNQDHMEPCSLKKVVEDTLALCQEKLKKGNVDLRIKNVPETPMVQCRPVQISQILLNLISNAADAIQSLPDKWIEISAEVVADSIRLYITDSGLGVDEKVQAKIFQPFFSTKELGKGVGLGLSISKGIAEMHGGSLTIDANSSNTRFVLSLPLKEAQGSTPIRQVA